jgi:peptidoglycan/LPS O-acetylase OafA/YrhL
MKFAFLDGLRGLAAVIVVIDHFAISFFQRATDASIKLAHVPLLENAILQTPLHILVSGNFAVCIFFVLSGFVLSAKFFATRDRRVVAASAWRRYIRLELPIFASVLLSFLLMMSPLLYNQAAASVTGSSWLRDLWTIAPSLPDALYHATIGVFIDAKSQYNTVLWTMQVELVGSFLVFALLFAVGRWRYRFWVYTALTVVLFHSYLLCFVAGVALCDWRTNRSTKLQLAKRSWIPLLTISLLAGAVPVGLLAGTWFSVLPEWIGYGMDVPTRMHILGAILLVFVLIATPKLQQVLAVRPFRYLGRVSFGLYLTHLLVMGALSCWLFVLLEPLLGYLPAFTVTFAVSAAAMWVVAHYFTRFVDEPAIKLSGMFYRKFYPTRFK